MDTSRQALSTMALTAALLGGCAGTPPPPLDAELAASNAAVNGAISAGAADAAPNELRIAREKLDRARVQRDARHYDDALALAREASVDARLAESKALAVKSRKSAADLQQANQVLAEEIKRKSNN